MEGVMPTDPSIIAACVLGGGTGVHTLNLGAAIPARTLDCGGIKIGAKSGWYLAIRGFLLSCCWSCSTVSISSSESSPIPACSCFIWSARAASLLLPAEFLLESPPLLPCCMSRCRRSCWEFVERAAPLPVVFPPIPPSDAEWLSDPPS